MEVGDKITGIPHGVFTEKHQNVYVVCKFIVLRFSAW